jgi:hypothetical protein
MYKQLSNIPNYAYDLNLPNETLGCNEVCGVDISGYYYSKIPQLFDCKYKSIEQLQLASDARRLVMSVTCCKPTSPFYILLSEEMHPTVRIRLGDKVIDTCVARCDEMEYRKSNLVGQMRKPYEAMSGMLYRVTY